MRGVSQQTKSTAHKLLKQNPKLLVETLYSDIHNLNIEISMIVEFRLEDDWINALSNLKNLKHLMIDIMKKSKCLEKKLFQMNQKKQTDFKALELSLGKIYSQMTEIKSMFNNIKKVTDNIREIHSKLKNMNEMVF
jgi:methyl-accepting chemotaxis protein